MFRSTTLVACGVLAALSGVGSPSRAEAKPKLPEHVYFQVEGQVYLFDYSAIVRARSQFSAWAGGCDELRVSQAVFPGDRALPGFAFSAVPVPSEMVLLGSSAADVGRRTGRDIDRVRAWAPVVTHRLCRSESGVTLEQATPADHVTYAVPWEAAAADGSPSSGPLDLEVTVNGRTEAIAVAEASRLRERLAAGSDLAGEPRRPELLVLGSSLNDPAAYGRTLYGLLWATQALDARYEWPIAQPLSTGCAWPCFKCGAAGVGLITGGTATLVAGCGTAAATLGAGCIAAGTAYAAGVVTLLDACFNCCTCVGSCSAGGGGGGGGGGEGEGGGEGGGTDASCPKGFHPCCDAESCCSDWDPPVCCHPPCV